MSDVSIVGDRGLETQARMKTILWFAIVSVTILAPFSLYNIVHGNYLLAAASGSVVLFLGVNGWLSYRQKYYPLLTLCGLAPAIIIAIYFTFQTRPFVAVLWCYPAIISFYFMLSERMAWVASTLLLVVAIPSALFLIETSLAWRVIATLLCVNFFAVIFLRIISSQQQQLHQIAITDSLTGLSNRVLFNSAMLQAVKQYERLKMPMSLITLDIDHFKQINDKFGHMMGDDVLVKIGEVIKARLRGSDKAFRMGGEEFLIFLFNTTEDKAVELAEELRLTMNKIQLDQSFNLTVSAGVTQLRDKETWQDWTNRTDKNLYHAKNSGRDSVVFADLSLYQPSTPEQ